MYQTSNPILSFFRSPYGYGIEASRDVMTVEGTALRTIFLAILTALSFVINWQLIENGQESLGIGFALLGSIGTFILGLIISFWAESAPFLAPVYALAEGCLLAGASYGINAAYPGIAVQAIGLTIFSLLGTAALYYLRIIQVTDKFRAIAFGATLGVALFYMIGGLLSFFGIQMPGLGLSGGLLSIVVSLVILTVAVMNLLMDFDAIEQGSGILPQYMEWYGAFGLLVTLIWMYLEFVRLLVEFAQLERR
jgi:uncharacterized YccA/Bax inhibitor family protein